MAPSRHRLPLKTPLTTLIQNIIEKETRAKLLKGSHSPFPYQLEAAVAIATGHDVVLVAPTGSGKTLVLAMPLLFHKTKVSIVISPLHALETDQARKMNQLGIKSVLVDTVDLPKDTVLDMNAPPHAYQITTPTCVRNGTCYRLL